MKKVSCEQNKTKKLYLIFHGRFLSEKAAALFAAKSCEAFAEEYKKVTLIVPRRFGITKGDPFEYYNIKKNFKIKYLPTLDLFFIPFFQKIAFYISFITFSLSCFIYIFIKTKKEDIIYSNESLPLLFISFLRKNIFFEVHDMPRGKFLFFKKLFQRIKGVVVTNTWKRDNIEKIFGVNKKKMLYEINAVDIEEFDIPMIQKEARAQLNLSLTGSIVLYTGHLYSWKGVDTLASAASLLPEGTKVYFVGGTKKDIDNFEDNFGHISNIVIVGHRNHKEMPVWQKAANVVVVPNTAKEEISKYDTSPMKIFEYMASRRPIVATNLPSIREILNDSNAVIVPPDNPKAIAGGIMEVLKNKERSKKNIDQAYSDIKLHSWKKRAERISRFLSQI